MKSTKILAILVVAVIAVSVLATVKKPKKVPKGKGWDQVWDALVDLQAQINTRTDAVYVHPEGNIGIGTTEPAHKLDVRGNIHASGAIGAGEGTLYLNKTEDAITSSSGEIYLGPESGNFEDVKVGIGTTTPGSPLDVVGNIAVNGTVDGVDVSAHAASDNAHHTPYTDAEAVAAMGAKSDTNPLNHDQYTCTDWTEAGGNVYRETGNVGIGTTSPGAKFEVVGNVMVSGTVDGVDVSNHAANANAHHTKTTDTWRAINDIPVDSVITESISSNWAFDHAASASAHHTPPTTLPPSGPAGGDLSGTYPNPTVVNDSHTHSNFTLTGVDADTLDSQDSTAFAKVAGTTFTGSVNFPGSGIWNSGGNVGIGTDSPTRKLEVNGTVKATGFIGDGSGLTNVPGTPDTDWTEAGGNVYRETGNVGIGTASLQRNKLSVIADPSNYNQYGSAAVYGYNPNTTGINSGGYFMSDSGGGYGVYGIAYGDGSKGVEGWGPEGGYDFFAMGPGTNYGVPSSIRWKTNITPIDNPLDKVLNLRGVYYNWDEEHGGEHDMGMIAEEVGKVLPEIVEYEEDGIYTTGMEDGKLTPLLVEAIKELRSENQALKQRIEALERAIPAKSSQGKPTRLSTEMD